jgi:hypothetical protein
LVASSQWSAEQEDFPEYPIPVKITSKDYKLDPDKILGAVENTKSTEGKQDNILVLVKFKYFEYFFLILLIISREISYRKLKWITPHTFDKYYSTCKAKLTMFLKNLDKPE